MHAGLGILSAFHVHTTKPGEVVRPMASPASKTKFLDTIRSSVKMEGLSPAIVEQLLPSMNALLATKYLAGEFSRTCTSSIEYFDLTLQYYFVPSYDQAQQLYW